ncbi:MAG: hypothetical protein FWD87_05365 [Spirochaetaceae bacterium]|nr:hypothetical protein [Spirochaetaceae bacterium]
MKFTSVDTYEPLLIALEKAGLKVSEIEKQGKKTVITVSPAGINSDKTQELRPIQTRKTIDEE